MTDKVKAIKAIKTLPPKFYIRYQRDVGSKSLYFAEEIIEIKKIVGFSREEKSIRISQGH